MDPGLAVVLGAVIALAGSSIIPWIRESTMARRLESQVRDERLRDATVDLLAANAAQGAALILDNDADLHQAFEARSRAAARLLLEVPPGDRRAVSDTINAASVGRDDTGSKIRAFQFALTAWAAGDLPAADVEAAYRDELKRLRGRAN